MFLGDEEDVLVALLAIEIRWVWLLAFAKDAEPQTTISMSCCWVLQVSKYFESG